MTEPNPLQTPRCSPATNLACPIDGTPIGGQNGALICAQGHSFDRARAGYTNLLVVQHKASRDPGDSKEMVAARRRFFHAGHFTSIAERTAAIVLDVANLHPDRSLTVVDAGCGEGYTLETIVKAANRATEGHLRLAGIDISKWAIQAAAKRTDRCFWAVASNRRLPFSPGSVDLILSMFGFPHWSSFAQVQPAGGRVLLVEPGPDHLLELRSIIYPVVNPTSPPDLQAAESASYRLEGEQRHRFSFELVGAEEIADLMAMTPHGHRASVSGRAELARRLRLTVTGDVIIRVLVR